MPSLTTDSVSTPEGDGVAYGPVNRDGKIKLKGYSNAGNKFSYSGLIIEGDMFMLFANPKNSRKESILGAIRFRDLADSSDMDGIIRYSQLSGSSGVPYASGYDERLSLVGSTYLAAGFGQIPAPGFEVMANNSVGSIAGGAYNGTNYIFTWESKGKMVSPKLPIYSSKAKMKNKYGMFTGKYVQKEASDGFAATGSSLRGVVIQKQELVSGQIITNKISGRYIVLPNESGDVAPSTIITPKKKRVYSNETTYIVQVVVDTAWQVVIPADVGWVTTDVALGVGNGQVEVTVATNSLEYQEREATIMIAGLEHKIEQDYRSDGSGGGGTGEATDVVLTPATRTVFNWSSGEVYLVSVTADGDWTVTIPPSTSGWVTVFPRSGTGNGVLTVTVAPNFFSSRTGSFLVGDAIHTIYEY
jgi:hypothetical protein